MKIQKDSLRRNRFNLLKLKLFSKDSLIEYQYNNLNDKAKTETTTMKFDRKLILILKKNNIVNAVIANRIVKFKT